MSRKCQGKAVYSDSAKLGVQAAYDAYVAWFASTGLLGKLGRKQFSKRLEAQLRAPKKRAETSYIFAGIALR